METGAECKRKDVGKSKKDAFLDNNLNQHEEEASLGFSEGVFYPTNGLKAKTFRRRRKIRDPLLLLLWQRPSPSGVCWSQLLYAETVKMFITINNHAWTFPGNIILMDGRCSVSIEFSGQIFISGPIPVTIFCPGTTDSHPHRQKYSQLNSMVQYSFC